LLNKLVFENLRQRPVRTCLSVLAIGVEVTMMLTLVGISYGTLHEAARRARGVGADILVRPPASSIISLSSSPMPESLVPFLMKQPHVTLATGTMGQPLGGFDVLRDEVAASPSEPVASPQRSPSASACTAYRDAHRTGTQPRPQCHGDLAGLGFRVQLRQQLSKRAAIPFQNDHYVLKHETSDRE
jgi:hypothetical protein